MSHNIALNEAESRYEITIDGDLAGYAQFAEKGEVRDFNHTVIFEDYRGEGLSGELVQYALDDSHDEGKKIVATCSAVKHFIEKHPGYKNLLAE